MKYLLVLCFLSLVVLSLADMKVHSRGCIYVEGRCVEDCPVGTHSYTTGCNRITPEATCDQPKPEEEDEEICDFTACYCDPSTVRDTKNNKCVPIEECPKEE